MRRAIQSLSSGEQELLSLRFEQGLSCGRIAEVLDMIKDECFVEKAPRTDGRIHFCLIGPPRKNGPKPQAPRDPAAGGGIRISVS